LQVNNYCYEIPVLMKEQAIRDIIFNCYPGRFSSPLLFTLIRVQMVNILVAEDDSDHFLLLEEAIENTLPQYMITHSRDGKDLLKRIDEGETPDMIFLDLNLPKKSGLDCLVEIRQRKALRTTPVVIYSTSSDFEDIDHCYKAGCTLFLVKPPSFKMLLLQIKKLFSHELAEEALRKSEEQFRLFIQATSNQVYKISADWKEMYLLAGKEFISGPDGLSNSWLNKNIPLEDQVKVQEAIQRASKSKSILELEHRVTMEDGTIGWTFFRAIPVLDDAGEVREWFGSAHDITDRKNAEKELREEHYFLEQITDNTPHLIYVFDLDEQRFIYVNKRIKELTGIEQEYVYGMGPHLFKMVLHPDDLSIRADYFNQLSRLTQGETKENEFRIKTAKGYRYFRSKDRIFKMENGVVKQIIGLAEDVTYEKRLQEKLSSEIGSLGMN
jgi:PAS domain S-box-containing protein